MGKCTNEVIDARLYKARLVQRELEGVVDQRIYESRVSCELALAAGWREFTEEFTEEFT